MGAQQHGGNLLLGMKAIAAHLGVKRRQAYHLHEKRATNQFPSFTMPDGRTVAARTGSLDEWVQRCERGEIGGESTR